MKPSYHVGKTYWVQRKINKKTNLPLTKLLKTHSFKVKIKQPHLTFLPPVTANTGSVQACPGCPAHR